MVIRITRRTSGWVYIRRVRGVNSMSRTRTIAVAQGVLFFCYLLAGFAVAADKKPDSTAASKASYDRWLSFSMGYTGYNMSELNKHFSSEGFPAKDDGTTYALEISVMNLQMGDIPLLSLSKISLPVMIEYFDITTRRESPSDAKWIIPVFGFSLGTVVPFDNTPIPEWVSIRPSIGYYQLGLLGMDAKFRESYVAGTCKLSGRAFGGQVGLRARSKAPLVWMEVGYRWLEFNDVSYVYSGEFLEWHEEGELPFMTPVDLSGLFIRVGFEASW